MLKITEFAKLAQTTRRTLILYDQQDIFKPALTNEEGYRFYNYDQLYELSFILTLRCLGLSLSEIKQVSPSTNKTSPNELLDKLQSRIDDQIHDLLQIKQSLTTRHQSIVASDPVLHDHPYITHRVAQPFWFSPILKECSPQQIAEAFTTFYQHLEPLVLINGKCSGFLLTVPPLDPHPSKNCPFQLLKEATSVINDDFVETITRPAGDFLAIETKTTDTAINHGIDLLRQYLVAHQLTANDKLWQINMNEDIRLAEATTAKVRLEYQLARHK
ncbi:MerR family transcriptional regulator [Furfurilactobacillus sp. WILCCON 0119]